MKPPFVRSPYNYDTDDASMQTGLRCKDPTLAQQQFQEECDINTIVERFHLTGEMPQLQQLPAYDDYHGIFDFQTAMNSIRKANETFMELPAKLRARFHNEPQEFLEFCANEENHDEARKLGILRPEPIPAPQETPHETRTESTTAETTESKKGSPGTKGTPRKNPPTQEPGSEDR